MEKNEETEVQIKQTPQNCQIKTNEEERTILISFFR